MEIHGNLAGTYATDVYGKKIASDYTTGSAKILGQVGLGITDLEV